MANAIDTRALCTNTDSGGKSQSRGIYEVRYLVLLGGTEFNC